MDMNLNVVLKPFTGTESNPPGCKGWHFNIRLIVSQPPFKAPNRSTASNRNESMADKTYKME